MKHLGRAAGAVLRCAHGARGAERGRLTGQPTPCAAALQPPEAHHRGQREAVGAGVASGHAQCARAGRRADRGGRCHRPRGAGRSCLRRECSDGPGVGPPYCVAALITTATPEPRGPTRTRRCGGGGLMPAPATVGCSPWMPTAAPCSGRPGSATLIRRASQGHRGSAAAGFPVDATAAPRGCAAPSWPWTLPPAGTRGGSGRSPAARVASIRRNPHWRRRCGPASAGGRRAARPSGRPSRTTHETARSSSARRTPIRTCCTAIGWI